MKAVVFLGPSLELDEARRILPDAVYLPPVAQGDLITALADHAPEVVGIVDGVFYQALPVWHKEIVYALEVGVRVLGAASMGALRAAECDAFGMVGVGEVYRRYASAMLAADDEVALAHADADHGWQKLSEPLVNVRATLEAEIEAGRVDAPAAEAFVAAARPIWFPKRTVAYLAEAARGGGGGAAAGGRCPRTAGDDRVGKRPGKRAHRHVPLDGLRGDAGARPEGDGGRRPFSA